MQFTGINLAQNRIKTAKNSSVKTQNLGEQTKLNYF